MASVEEKIRNFIVEELNWEGSPSELTDDLPLLERGLVDSLGIFQLVSFIESEFGVEVNDEELVPEHFGSVGKMAQLVESKRGS
jgi:acyl carrier protein